MHPMIVGRIVIFCCLLPLIISFGIFGNIITLAVLFKGRTANPTSIYIANLAAADLLTLFIKSASILSIWWQIFWPEEYFSWKVNSYSIFSLSYFSEKISKCITMAIVYDRIVAVKWPFKYKSVCTTRRALIIMAAIYFVVTSISFPVIVDIFAYFQSREANVTFNKFPTTSAESNQYVTSRLYKTNVILLITKVNRIIEFTIIPVIVVGNAVIIRGRQKGNSENQIVDNAGQHRKRMEKQLTKLCLTISFTFLCLCGPFDVFSFLVITELIQRMESLQPLPDVVATLLTLNSAVNFVIYAATNTRYRQAYVDILPCTRQVHTQVSPEGQVAGSSSQAIAKVNSDLKQKYETRRATAQLSCEIKADEKLFWTTRQSSRKIRVCREIVRGNAQHSLNMEKDEENVGMDKLEENVRAIPQVSPDIQVDEVSI